MIKYLKWVWLFGMMGVNTYIVMNWERIDPFLRGTGSDAFGPMGFWFVSFIFIAVLTVILTLFE